MMNARLWYLGQVEAYCLTRVQVIPSLLQALHGGKTSPGEGGFGW